MNDLISIITASFSLLSVVICMVLLRRRGEAADLTPLTPRFDALEAANAKVLEALRAEALRDRSEAGEAAARLRTELAGSSQTLQQSVTSLLADLGGRQQTSLDRFAEQVKGMADGAQEQGRSIRDEVSRSLQLVGDATASQLKVGGEAQQQSLATFASKLTTMSQAADNAGRDLRQEITQSLTSLGGAMTAQAKLEAEQQRAGLDGFAKRLETLQASLEQRLQSLTENLAQTLTRFRDESRAVSAESRKESTTAINSLQLAVKAELASNAAQLQQQLGQIGDATEKRLESLRATVDQRLNQLQADNASKLEQMRQTVDEKLQGTLERRLGESFRLVSERLEQVQRGLGDMQSLANGVGDLKKVLVNVKTRGTWGECQLGTLLEQMLAPDQYDSNVATIPGSNHRVEFAIRFPDRDGDASKTVWLPIDAKCPMEDYQRLVEAAEQADAEGVRDNAAKLESRIRASAKDIATKYVASPHTTDFAIMFIPTEGLYAELLRMPGLQERLQQEFRVLIAGPTNLAAILNTIQMGFRSLAIQQRSGEVWKVLSGVKTEFTKFGGVLEKVKKQLNTASNTIDEATSRTRVMERKLREVQELPLGQSPVTFDFVEPMGDLDEPTPAADEAA
jgi:DNA recombination protein RmuC